MRKLKDYVTSFEGNIIAEIHKNKFVDNNISPIDCGNEMLFTLQGGKVITIYKSKLI